MGACFGLFLVVFVLAVIAVVGHLIWLAMAAVLRGISEPPGGGSTSPDLEESGKPCVLCGRGLIDRRRRCVRCGLDSRRDEAIELRELETTLQQLDHLERSGYLPAHTHDYVRHSIDERRHDLVRGLEALVGHGQRRQQALPTVRPVPTPRPATEPLALAPMAVAEVEPAEVQRLSPIGHDFAASVAGNEVNAEPKPKFETAPTPLPTAPRRSFGEMLTGFMEERNILWGELVGGLLIVGCSIALVISLREALEQIPFFPFVMVAAVAAALIGAGRYTLSHWRLESTSRGLLVIGTLLVPLSFTVLAGLAFDRQGGPVELLAVEIAALALFTWLVRGAASIVLRPSIGGAAPLPDWLATAAIMGASASQLLVPHIFENDMTRDWLGLVGYVPAALFVATQGLSWQRVYRQNGIGARQAGGLFLGLGLAAYAVAVAFGFILYRAANIHQALAYLAVPVALAGLPLLLGGTIATAKLKSNDATGGPEGEPGGLPLGVAGVIATMLTLSGTLILLLALAAAWPNPVRLTAIASVNAVVLTIVAHRFRLAPAYLPAQICFAVAALTGYHALADNLLDLERAEQGIRLLQLWTASSSGVVLLCLAALFAVAAEWQMRGGRAGDGRCLGIGSGVAALASLLLVAFDGWQTPDRAALVFGAVAVGGWLTNAQWRLTWLTAASALIAFGAAFFGVFWYDRQLALPHVVVWSLLAAAIADVALAAALKVLGRIEEQSNALDRVYVAPLQLAGLLASAGSAALLIFTLDWDLLGGACVAALGIAGVWVTLAWQRKEPILFAFFQVALAVAVLLGVVRVLQDQPWFTSNAAGLLGDVRSWQAYGIGLSALALAWVAGRFGFKRSPSLWGLLEPGWPALDRLLLGGLVIAALIVMAAGAAPGVAEELTALGPNAQARQPELLQVSGPLGWCWLGLLGVALGMALWQERADNVLLGVAVVGICPVMLAAAAFDGDIAVASALRWGLSLYFVALSALIWRRQGLAKLATGCGMLCGSMRSLAQEVGAILIVGAVLPVLLLTGAVAEIGFARLHPAGPLAESVFHEIGVVANNMLPLALLCFGLAGHGLRERSAGYTFAAGLVALLAVTGGYALKIVTGGGSIGNVEVIELGQLATGVLAVWLLGWLAVRRRLVQSAPAASLMPRNALGCSVMLSIQEGLLWASYLLWLAPALALLVFVPTLPMDEMAMTGAAGSWLGWVVFGLAMAAGVVHGLDAKNSGASWLARMSSAGLMAGVLAACTCTQWDAEQIWLGYHVLTLSWLLVAGGLLVAGWRADRLRQTAGEGALPPWLALVPTEPVVRWICSIAAAVAVLAFCGGWSDPYRPTWPAVVVLAVSAIMGALAVWTRRGGLVYGSGLLINAAGHLFWVAWAQDYVLTTTGMGYLKLMLERLVLIHIGCLGLASLLWSWLQLSGPSIMGLPRLVESKWPFRHVALRATIWALTALVTISVMMPNWAFIVLAPLGPLDLSIWYAIAVVLVAVAATLWDNPDRKWACPWPQFYWIGLIILATAQQQVRLDSHWQLWALGSYVLLTSLVCVTGLRQPELGETLGLPQRPGGWPLAWFGVSQLVVGILVVLGSILLCCSAEEMWARFCSFLAVGCLPAAGVLLTPHWSRLAPAGSALHGTRPPLATLLLGVVAGVLLHCSFVGPLDVAPWLHRSVLAMAAVTWMAVIYGLLLPRVLSAASEWSSVARRLTVPLGIAACAILALVLVQEFFMYDQNLRRTPLNAAGVVVVSIALAALIGGSLTFALSAAQDQLKRDDRGRTLCVYAAEGLLVLLLFHLRLNVPRLFPGFLEKYWVFVIVAVAFLGVGLSELCQRRGLSILAGPLQRTAMFLPLLPLFAFLIRPLKDPLSEAGSSLNGLSPLIRYLGLLPDDYRMHAAVWFLVGLLYLVVALTRRSSNLALGAAVVANFGLWVILGNQHDLSFVLHPQLWLIPIGVIVLVAESLNRDRLQESQALALRYAGMLVIYVSSSADMFIAGLGGNVLLPIALALLSVSGVLIGILLRVRAFLLLGVTFLFLVVFSQIWHAAVDRAQTWVWWASGLVLGVAILTLFALFEKRRNDVLKLIDEIKRWR